MTSSATQLFGFIKKHGFTGSTTRLARILMSMHNQRTRVNFYEDLQGFDPQIQRLVLQVVTEFITGVYRDGDFNPIATYLIDDLGYWDDVSLAERLEWIRAHLPKLKIAFTQLHNLEPHIRDYLGLPGSIYTCEHQQAFETYCCERYAEIQAQNRW